MASRQIKMPVKDDSDKEVDEAPSQRKRPEAGRYSAPGRPPDQGLLPDSGSRAIGSAGH